MTSMSISSSQRVSAPAVGAQQSKPASTKPPTQEAQLSNSSPLGHPAESKPTQKAAPLQQAVPAQKAASTQAPNAASSALLQSPRAGGHGRPDSAVSTSTPTVQYLHRVDVQA
jgi:hypothetical protein